MKERPSHLRLVYSQENKPAVERLPDDVSVGTLRGVIQRDYQRHFGVACIVRVLDVEDREMPDATTLGDFRRMNGRVRIGV